MILGIPRETPTAMTPELVDGVRKLGLSCLVESGTFLGDESYRRAGAEVVGRGELRERADVVFVLAPETWPDPRPGTTLIGFPPARETAFSLERLPRITRAQSMDVLSTFGTLAGYRAVLVAAERSPRLFPMLTTAAGTIAPAQVLVLGAGVAGLMAMATARRLGAVVTGYDIRAAAQEEIRSVGARALAPPNLQEGGTYAAEQPEEQLRRQQEGLREAVSRAHVLIATAAVPGRKAPLLVTEAMLDSMPAGAVVVDLGNCARAHVRTSVRELAGQLPIPASSMLARNLLAFLSLWLQPDSWQDELIVACRISGKELSCEDRSQHPLPRVAPGQSPGPLGLAAHLQP